MLEILISSTVLILALTALRFFLRGKLNPRLQYTLWLLAALRLLLPVSLVRSPVSVMNAVPDVPAAVQRLTAPENRRAPQTDNTQSPVQTASETETAPTEAQMQLTGSTILKLVWLTGAAAMAHCFIGTLFSPSVPGLSELLVLLQSQNSQFYPHR